MAFLKQPGAGLWFVLVRVFQENLEPGFPGKCRAQSAFFMMKDRHMRNPIRHRYKKKQRGFYQAALSSPAEK
ncbi:hypothetical protein [Rhizobium oryziradicis]|uniref:Uncharacterized protein n=1 Tax=Rhizobium oryziradicis TaxID=1867956 RepID=A0A1Q8ZNP8_9HYPH|nr:hypothetical protein [Rhizobium oryziradicis]OLP43520.1 hypothetical protein BJF95_21895 [Rhizobium oryziradicis]